MNPETILKLPPSIYINKREFALVTILPPGILSCDWLVTSTGKILIGLEMQAGPDFVKPTKHNNLINLL